MGNTVAAPSELTTPTVLVTAGADSTLGVWGVRSAVRKHGFKSFRPVHAVAAIGDSYVLCDCGMRVLLWDIRRKRCCGAFQKPPVASTTTSSRAAWDDGYQKVILPMGDTGRFVTGEAHEKWMSRCAVGVWDLRHSEPIALLNGHKDSINALVGVSDTQCFSGAEDGVVLLWDLQRKKCIYRLADDGYNDNMIYSLAHHAPKGLLFSGSYKSLSIYNRNGEEVAALPHIDNVTAIAPTESGTYVVTGDSVGRLQTWDLRKLTARGRKEPVWQHKKFHTNAIKSLILLDGRHLVTCAWDGGIRVGKVRTGTLLLSADDPWKLNGCCIAETHKEVSDAFEIPDSMVADVEDEGEQEV